MDSFIPETPSSSRPVGTPAWGLAMAAVLRGYRMIAVMADKQSKEKQDLLRAYGAEVVVCPSDVGPDDPRSYYSVAAELASRPGHFRPDQYSNPANPQAQHDSAGPEVWSQTDGQVGVFVAGVGTGGTITGIGRYLKEQGTGVTIVGVDPAGSIFTAPTEEHVHPYLIEGVGEDFWPKTFDPAIVDEWEMVSDGRGICHDPSAGTDRGDFGWRIRRHGGGGGAPGGGAPR